MSKLNPILESLGSVVEIFAFIVLFIVLPVLIYSCKRIIDRCYLELKRQNHYLQNQTNTLNELNSWMDYFDDKMLKTDITLSKKNNELRRAPTVEKFKPKPEKNPPAEKVITPKKRSPVPDKQDLKNFPSTPASIYKKTI